MEQYQLSSWGDDYKENADKIYSISCQIQSATKRIVKCGITQNQAEILLNNIIGVLGHWTGSTYVGVDKEKILKKAYQAFFSALYEMILKCRETKNDTIREYVNGVLYRGKIYRYLGNSGDDNYDGRIEPIFNDIYVSWSKEPTNSYIESKLYGTMTVLSAEINEPYYGIDLEGIEKFITLLTNKECRISRGNEREVIFPTIKECITEIKYIEDDYEEQEDDQT